MGKLILPLLVFTLMSCKQGKVGDAGAAQTIADSVQASVDNDTIAIIKDNVPGPADPIASIRKKVEQINTIELEKRSFEFMCDEKMKVDYFYNNGEIVKVAVDFGTVGDVYAKEGYYYDRGELIFVYEFTEGGPACEGCISTNEYRTYVKNNEVIKHLKNKEAQDCRKCDFNSSSRHYRLLKASGQEEVKAIMCPGI